MIPIRNIYYMLSYAFQILKGEGYSNMATEDFDNVADLCAAILCRGVSLQIKRGLGHEYIEKTEPLSALRGRIDMGESIKTRSITKQRLVCSYDDFSINFPLNQIIKTTMELLIREGIPKTRKKELRNLLVYFDGVQSLDIHSINWNVQYHRNNDTYRMLVFICYLVIKGKLQSAIDGTAKLMHFSDEHMFHLYEKFILEFYRREYPQYHAQASQIRWMLDDENDMDSMLPIMQSDIMLSYHNRILIIDAKYYTKNTQELHGKQSLISQNLYQIFTYVKNKQREVADQGIIVSGILLYAGTDSDLQPDNVYRLGGNVIGAKTLDLNREFSLISKQLDRIADEYIKTMFELNKRYGWSKFIVVVPSIAIREGVKKSFEITVDHFMELYGKKARFFIYSSANLNQLDSFSSDSGINVMIINTQAFAASMNEEKNVEGRKGDAAARIIFSKRDEFGSRRPIDVIAANRPIIIMDEPQKMGGEVTQKTLAKFNPLFILNYSATHAKQHNLVYVLDALDAYNKKLVKRIEVKGFEVKNLQGTHSYLYPERFACHLDRECFHDPNGNTVGFHTKGYLFEFEDHQELMVGSSNITVYALLKNIEWDVSVVEEGEGLTYTAAKEEFGSLWQRTLPLDQDLIDEYKTRLYYSIERWDMDYDVANSEIKPNYMQRRALKELNRIRAIGAEKALVVASAGSGKTYLAAFDALNFNPKRLLYIVHEGSILTKSFETFQRVFGSDRSYGIYNGEFKEPDADFVFSTNITMANSLELFDPHTFGYIIIDECHHATAKKTYKRILDYFEPEFLLGITATPERMDGDDVFSLFDQNVPYELRLRDAIINGLVVPFKYYGIRDELIEYGINATKGHQFVEQFSDEKHCDFIYKMIEAHRQPGQKLKALAFCRDVSHAIRMAQAMEDYYPNGTRYLTGKNSTGERVRAYKDLQNESSDLQILFTVDILNEGVDIPSVNMVLFLRPTDSQTIFIQQLGRGLRTYEGKKYVTVLDFIGNDYKRSVQIAFALGIIDEMICNAWYSVREFHIHLSGLGQNGEVLDGLERAVLKLSELSDLPSNASKVEIRNAIRQHNSELRKAKEQLTNMVPYRAMAGFFASAGVESVPWDSIVKMRETISTFSYEVTALPYTLGANSKLGKEVIFHPDWIRMIQDYTVSILGWIQYEKVKWLQNNNPEVPGLVYKLLPMDEKMRKLGKVRTLWEAILSIQGISDVFTGKPVVPGNYDVDHFIPWSFVMNDELWNLMPMDSSLNSTKSNKLPQWDPFYRRFSDNQYIMYQLINDQPGIHKLYEQCWRDNLHSIWAGQELYRPGNSKEVFDAILSKNMRPVYDSARRQGYEVWKLDNP